MKSPAKYMEDYLRVLYICYDNFDENRFDDMLCRIQFESNKIKLI